MTNYEKAKEILKEYNQEQILSNYERVTEEKKELLINQILGIDFEQVNELYQETKKVQKEEKYAIEPISYIDKSKLLNEEIEKYKETGIEEIKKGKLAVVTMAGRTTGQG